MESYNNFTAEKEKQGNAMNRQEAVAVLQEIVDVCKRIGVKQITLKAVTESVGYELHIKDHFNEQDTKCIEDILKKHKLLLKNKPMET